MKKLIRIGVISSLLVCATASFAVAPKEETKAAVTEVIDSAKIDSAIVDSAQVVDSAAAASKVEVEPEAPAEDIVEKESEWHQVIKEKMIEGGVEFMGIVLLCLILGLTISIERVITLNLATTNTKKLLNVVKEKMFGSSIDDARTAVSEIKGPIAGIIAQGLMRLNNGETTGEIESSVVNHGSSEMAKLEKGLSWINLFISLAPMFGFMGTVIGMIQAFDMIQSSGEMEIGSVAGGIKVALLTTVAGLVVAIILQVFYNYCVSKIEDLSSEMEESSNTFMDMVSRYKREKGV